MNDEFHNNLGFLNEIVRTKEKNIENLRKRQEEARIEAIKIFCMDGGI